MSDLVEKIVKIMSANCIVDPATVNEAAHAAISAVLEDMMAVDKAVSEAGHDRLADDGTIEDLFRHMIAAYAKANGIEIGRRG